MQSKKSIVTLALLLFVAAAAGVLIVKETRRTRQVREAEAARATTAAPTTATNAVATPAPPLPTPAPAAPPSEKNAALAKAPAMASAGFVPAKATVSRKVVVYYLRTTTRCPSCFKIETFTEAAVIGGFPEPLRNGSLEWKSFNTDEPKYEHFVKDYELFTKSVVVSQVVNGKEVRWKRLDKVWDLLDDKNAFMKYIQEEVRGYLGP